MDTDRGEVNVYFWNLWGRGGITTNVKEGNEIYPNYNQNVVGNSIVQSWVDGLAKLV